MFKVLNHERPSKLLLSYQLRTPNINLVTTTLCSHDKYVRVDLSSEVCIT